MKRSRFTDEQIIAILKEQETGVAVTELCRKHGVSSASFYAWKAKYGGLDVSDAKRLRALESENAKLKKLLAAAMLDCRHAERDARKKLLTPGSRRNAVAWAIKEKSRSQRRACGLVGMHRRPTARRPPRSGRARPRCRRVPRDGRGSRAPSYRGHTSK